MDITIHQHQQLSQTELSLNDESVFIEPFSIQLTRGRVALHDQQVKFKDKLTYLKLGTAFSKLCFTGTGQIVQKSSFCHFSTIDLSPDEDWLLDLKMFWACTEHLQISVKTSSLQETMRGLPKHELRIAAKQNGSLLLKTPGELEFISLNNDIIRCSNNLIARSASLHTSIEPFKQPNYLGIGSSSEKYYTLRGTGKIILVRAENPMVHLIKSLGFVPRV